MRSKGFVKVSFLFDVFFSVKWQFRFRSFPVFRFLLQLSASQRFSFSAFSLLGSRLAPPDLKQALSKG